MERTTPDEQAGDYNRSDREAMLDGSLASTNHDNGRSIVL